MQLCLGNHLSRFPGSCPLAIVGFQGSEGELQEFGCDVGSHLRQRHEHWSLEVNELDRHLPCREDKSKVVGRSPANSQEDITCPFRTICFRASVRIKDGLEK